MKPYRGIKLPEGMDGAKINNALKKMSGQPVPVVGTPAALLPLTPQERGFALGVLYEAHATMQEEAK